MTTITTATDSSLVRLARLATTTTDRDQAIRAVRRAQDLDPALASELEEEAVRRAALELNDVLGCLEAGEGIWSDSACVGDPDAAWVYRDEDGDLYCPADHRTGEGGGYEYDLHEAAERLARSLLAWESQGEGWADVVGSYLALEERYWYLSVGLLDRTCGARDCTRCYS